MEENEVAGDEENAAPGEKTMGFLDHLEELRVTLFKCVIALLAGVIVVAINFDQIIGVLNWPLDEGTRGRDPTSLLRVTNSLMSVFSVYISVGLLGAVVIAMPFALFFFGQFVAPALTQKEKRLLVPGGLAAIILFLLGGAFAYFLLMPSVVNVALEYNEKLGTQVVLAMDTYYSTMAWMILGMGAAFQFPMIIQILVFLDLLQVATLRKWRQVAIVVCLVVAALITPTPDPLNMFACAIPLYVLYEAAIVVASVFTSKLAAKHRA